jgi:hypothetical protein
MDINAKKIKLIQCLLDTDDKTILEAVGVIFENQNKDFWRELTPEEQEQINIRIQSENHGDIVDF